MSDLDIGAPRLLFWNISEAQNSTAISNVYLSTASHDGKIIACAEDKQSSSVVSLRDTKTGRIIRTLDARNEIISALLFDPSSQRLATVDKNGLLKVWNVISGQLNYALHGVSLGDSTEFVPSFSTDGKLLSLISIPLGRQALANIWNTSTGRSVDQFETNYSTTLYFVDETILSVEDYRNGQTFLFGINTIDKFKVLPHMTFPRLNPTRTLIAFRDSNNGIDLYAIQ